jgi:MFS family permease
VPAHSYQLEKRPAVGPPATQRPARGRLHAIASERVGPALQRHGLVAAVAIATFALAFQSGSYDVSVRNQFAIVAWWGIAVAVGALVWPVERPPRAALLGGAALTALLAWTAIAISWSDSAERAFTEVNRTAFYLAIFMLVVAASRRGSGSRWADGLAIGIAATALLGLTSRLFPDLIGDRGVSSFFPGGTRYLGYPLDYWNGLGIFVALGFPLLLRAAVDARSVVARALAIGFGPALVATLFLTASRGGMATAALGTLVFLALCRERLRATLALAILSAGGAAAVAVISARQELADGNLAAHGVAAQGRSAALLILAICLATGVVYGLIARASLPALRLPMPRAVVALAALVLVGAAVVAADPAARFESFKQPPRNPFARVNTSGTENASGGSGAVADRPRLAPTSRHLLSSTGNGRWQFWNAAVDEFETKPLTGRGPGSYESWWAQHGSVSYFTRHAHSLYLETLAELGLIGLALLLAFLLTGIVAGLTRLRRVDEHDRNVIAALTGVVIALCFAAGIDWIWQLTVVPVVAIVALAVLAGPATATEPGVARPRARAARIAARAAVAVAGLCLIAAQAIPYLAQDDIRRSQHRFAAGDLDGARDSAISARDVQPWAASPRLQLALVDERRGQLADAGSAISDAIDRDPLDWRLWLTAARIDGAAGRAKQARTDLDRAIALNPRSPLLSSLRRSER